VAAGSDSVRRPAGSLASGRQILEVDFRRLQKCFDGRLSLSRCQLLRTGTRWRIRLWGTIKVGADRSLHPPGDSLITVCGSACLVFGHNGYGDRRRFRRALRLGLVAAAADLATENELGVSACFRPAALTIRRARVS